jgi:hypothetical protein
MSSRFLKHVFAGTFGMSCLLGGCKANVIPQTTKPALDQIARDYIRLVVGLGEHDADSIDYYYGPPEWVTDIRKTAPPLSEIRQSALKLVEVLTEMPIHDALSSNRKTFLAGQLQSIACRAASLSGSPLTFDQETRCFFGITVPPKSDEKALAETRSQISRLVGGHGNLAERYTAFESRYIVPQNHLEAVMRRAIQACRSQTLKHIALPSDEVIDLKFAGNEPWAGYSLYTGTHKSIVTINTDFTVTIDRALDLACHETYPGHHVFNMTRDDVVAKQGNAPELMVQPTYSPQSFLSEGAATIASQVAFSPAERARFEREELLPLAGLPPIDVSQYLKVEALVNQLQPAIPVIARQYLDGQLEFSRASSTLEDTVLMGQTFDALKYMNEFRTYIVTYTYSPEYLKKYLPNWGTPDAEDRRWNVYSHWMRTESVLSGPLHDTAECCRPAS